MTVSYRVNRVVYNIESVDSICRDTTYTQYKSQKRYTYKPLLTAYHSSSSVLSFFFLLSDGLAQRRLNPS